MNDTTLNTAAATPGTGADALKEFITGKLNGAYWITSTGSVYMEQVGVVVTVSTDKGAAAGTPGDATGTIVKAAAEGDPWYLNLYFDETTDQFVSKFTGAGEGSGPDVAPIP